MNHYEKEKNWILSQNLEIFQNRSEGFPSNGQKN
jgi:hypothetical protein